MNLNIDVKLVKGFEPPTYGLQIRCSTIELHQLHPLQNYTIYSINFNKFKKNFKC